MTREDVRDVMCLAQSSMMPLGATLTLERRADLRVDRLTIDWGPLVHRVDVPDAEVAASPFAPWPYLRAVIRWRVDVAASAARAIAAHYRPAGVR